MQKILNIIGRGPCICAGDKDALRYILENFGLDEPFTVTDIIEVSGRWAGKKWKAKYGKKTLWILSKQGFLDKTAPSTFRLNLDGYNMADDDFCGKPKLSHNFSQAGDCVFDDELRKN